MITTTDIEKLLRDYEEEYPAAVFELFSDGAWQITTGQGHHCFAAGRTPESLIQRMRGEQ